MKKNIALFLFAGLSLALVLPLSACGGAQTKYTVSGTLSGLASGKHLVLQNNNADDLTLSADGSFTFATKLADGAAYSVTVKTQPPGQTCTVTNGSGAISGADVSNVEVSCADSGSLDVTFGVDGVVTYDGGLGDDRGYAVAVDAGGKVLIAGQSYSAVGPAMAIWRYRKIGTLDTSFGVNGVVLSSGSGRAITLDSSGKILVAGYKDKGNNDGMAIWRYDSSGTADNSFASGGMVTTADAHDNYGYSIALDGSNKIVVAGSTSSGSTTAMALWRYDAAGEPDAAFNNTGRAVFSSGHGFDRGTASRVLAGGKILVAGRCFNGHDFDMKIWRYMANGELDTGFANSGVVDYDSGGDDAAAALVVDGYGRILVTGHSRDGSTYNMKVWRYTAAGVLDTSFNNSGIVTYDDGHNDHGNAIALDSLGNIVVAGYRYNGSFSEVVLWRYKADGAPDGTFGDNGMAVYSDGRDNYPRAIALAPSGKIIVVGFGDNGSDSDLKIWRFIP